MKPEIGTGAQAQVKGHAHPTAKTFLGIGVVLAIITAVEFATYYVTGWGTLMYITLAVLSVVKFWLVGSYFMHLRYEQRLLAAVFAVGVVLATLMTIALKFVNLA